MNQHDFDPKVWANAKNELPTNWRDTLKDHSVESEWLLNPELCQLSPKQMVAFLKRTSNHAMAASKKYIVTSENDIPQSYLHWWCFTYNAIIARKNETDIYTVAERWRQKIEEWNDIAISAETKTNTNSISATATIGIFQLWLDILFLDISMYKDEDMRQNVPRLCEGKITWNASEQVQPKETRLTTLKYIMSQGKAIFDERGWVDGIEYWNNECKKFSILS